MQTVSVCSPSDAPFRVLSAHSGSPQYDGEILRLLLEVRPNTEYVVVQATGTYAKLKAEEKLGSHVTLVEASLLEAVPHASVTTPERPDGPASESVGKDSGDALAPASFDLVHCPLWRKPFGHNTSAALDVLMHLTKVGGSLLTLTFAPAGVFNLRDRLAVRLGRQPGELPTPDTQEGAASDLVGERPELRLSLWLHERVGSAWAAPGQVSAPPLATPHTVVALQDTGLAGSKSQLSHTAASTDAVWAWRERLASHVDVTALLSEELNATTQRALEDFVETRISAMQAADPEILEDVLLDLVDMSLDGDGIRGNIVVYTPLDATVVRRPTPPSSQAAALVKADTPHAEQYLNAVKLALPLLPIDVFALASALSPNAVECALGLSDYLKLNPDVMSDPHNNLKLCPLRGSWGSFLGTGASTEAALRSVSQTLQVHDAAVAAGQDSASVAAEKGATAGSHADSDAIGGNLSSDAVSRSVLARDPWWPQGRRGTFFNAGLQNWYDMRETWTARTTNMQKPPMPPAVDYDQVYDELAVLRRSYTLPGPMRLQDIVELFVEMWAAEEQNTGPQAGHASMFSQGMYAQGNYGMR